MRVGIRSSSFVVPGSSITATFQQTAVDVASRTVYTFAAQPIGTASPTRRVVVAVAWRQSGSTVNLTSATIGGVSASFDQVPSPTTSGAGGNGIGIISAVVPTGTTADVVVNIATAPARMGIGLWTLTDGSPTGQVAEGTGSGPFDLSLTTVAGGVAIAAAAMSSAITWAWDITERYDGVVEAGFNHSGADVAAVGASTTITCTPSTGLVNHAVSAAYA